MRDNGVIAAAAAKARFIMYKLRRAGEASSEEEARLAEARRLDADEVGRRADQRAADRAMRASPPPSPSGERDGGPATD